MERTTNPRENAHSVCDRCPYRVEHLSNANGQSLEYRYNAKPMPRADPLAIVHFADQVRIKPRTKHRRKCAFCADLCCRCVFALRVCAEFDDLISLTADRLRVFGFRGSVRFHGADRFCDRAHAPCCSILYRPVHLSDAYGNNTESGESICFMLRIDPFPIVHFADLVCLEPCPQANADRATCIDIGCGNRFDDNINIGLNL